MHYGFLDYQCVFGQCAVYKCTNRYLFIDKTQKKNYVVFFEFLPPEKMKKVRKKKQTDTSAAFGWDDSLMAIDKKRIFEIERLNHYNEENSPQFDLFIFFNSKNATKTLKNNVNKSFLAFLGIPNYFYSQMWSTPDDKQNEEILGENVENHIILENQQDPEGRDEKHVMSFQILINNLRISKDVDGCQMLFSFSKNLNSFTSMYT